MESPPPSNAHTQARAHSAFPNAHSIRLYHTAAIFCPCPHSPACQVDQQQLMRVYGALMWSLGKVFRSPEVCRVYIGRCA